MPETQTKTQTSDEKGQPTTHKPNPKSKIESLPSSEGKGPKADDPVIQPLHEAEREYKRTLARLQETEAELSARTQQLSSEEARTKHLASQLDTAKKHLEAERKRSERERTRAKEISSCLKDVHRALFEGNIYSLI